MSDRHSPEDADGATSESGAQRGTVLYGHEQDPTDNEYATRPEVWRPLSRAVDGFDVDPCSGAEPTPIAPTRYDRDDDGLAQKWHGAVWMNPPWSSTDGSAKETWLRKARNEAARDAVDVVVGILPVDASATWFHEHVLRGADAVCLCDRRYPFIGESRNPSFSLVVFAFGRVDAALLNAMDELGMVLVDGDRHDPMPQATIPVVCADGE